MVSGKPDGCGLGETTRDGPVGSPLGPSELIVNRAEELEPWHRAMV